MRSFSVVLLVVILGLSHAFSLAAHNRDTWNQVQRVYRMGIMGDFEVDDYHVDGSDLEQNHMLYMFFILVTVAITISMLNLLIAVISDTYDRVNENMVSRLHRARAARIAELERAYNGKLRMPCGYLMILQPAHRSDRQDWQGRIATIPKRTYEILQGELKDIKDAQGKLEGELKEVHKFLENLLDKFNTNVGTCGGLVGSVLILGMDMLSHRSSSLIDFAPLQENLGAPRWMGGSPSFDRCPKSKGMVDWRPWRHLVTISVMNSSDDEASRVLHRRKRSAGYRCAQDVQDMGVLDLCPTRAPMCCRLRSVALESLRFHRLHRKDGTVIF
eukprot:s145_g32.t1